MTPGRARLPRSRSTSCGRRSRRPRRWRRRDRRCRRRAARCRPRRRRPGAALAPRRARAPGSGRRPIAVAPFGAASVTVVSPPHDDARVVRALRRGGDQRPRDRLAGARGFARRVAPARCSSRAEALRALRRDAVQRESIVPDDAAGDVRERRMRLRGRLRNRATRDAGEVVAIRRRNAREEIRALKQVGHVGDARSVGDARAASRSRSSRRPPRRRSRGSASRPAPARARGGRRPTARIASAPAFVAAMSRPEPSSSSWSTTRSDSFIARSGAPIRLDAPPEISTIATSVPRRPDAISAIFAAASNEWRPGIGWSPRIDDDRRIRRRRVVRSDDQHRRRSNGASEASTSRPPPPSAARPCRRRRSRDATPRSIGSASTARAVAGPGAAAATAASYNSKARARPAAAGASIAVTLVRWAERFQGVRRRRYPTRCRRPPTSTLNFIMRATILPSGPTTNTLRVSSLRSAEP